MKPEAAQHLALIRETLKAKQYAQALKPQFWKPQELLRRITQAPRTQTWLQTTDSLTQRLRNEFQTLEIEILSEEMERPLMAEAQKLNSSLETETWIRCVLLNSEENALVYARTVIPFFDAQNPWHELQKLGNQPLGEVLFLDKTVQRSGFEFAKIALNDLPHYRMRLSGSMALAHGIARRSVFYKNNFPLLLTEVFLPPHFE